MFSKKIYIIFSPLEDKIHIFAPAFNFLYIVYIYLVLVNDELSEDKPVSSEEEEMSEQRSKTKPNRSNASKGNLFQPVFFFFLFCNIDISHNCSNVHYHRHYHQTSILMFLSFLLPPSESLSSVLS